MPHLAAQASKSPAVSIRTAQIEDASRIAQLCAQLGYPVASNEVERRIARHNQTPENVVYVAALQDSQVIGWVHAFVFREKDVPRLKDLAQS